jgi:hypothetical protein
LKVMKFSKSVKRDRPTCARIGELDVADHLAEYFHGARPAIAAIADESDGLVVPFAVQEIDRILEAWFSPQIMRGSMRAVEVIMRSPNMTAGFKLV